MTHPLSCQKFVEILSEAGLPNGWAQFICCEIPLAEKLVTDPRVSFLVSLVSGTGWMAFALDSWLPEPGLHLNMVELLQSLSASRHDKKKSLIPKMVKGGFYHSGQVCVSVQRIFALANNSETIAEQISELAKKIGCGKCDSSRNRMRSPHSKS